MKTTTEQIQLRLTFSKAAKAKLQARFAERRVWEMARLAQEGRTAHLAALAVRFEAHLAKIEQLAARIEATDPEDSVRISELREILYANMAKDLALLDKAEAKAPWRARNAIAVAKFRLIQQYDKAIAVLDELQSQQRVQVGSPGDAESAAQSGGSGGSSVSGQQGELTRMGIQVQARHAGSR